MRMVIKECEIAKWVRRDSTESINLLPNTDLWLIWLRGGTAGMFQWGQRWSGSPFARFLVENL